MHLVIHGYVVFISKATFGKLKENFRLSLKLVIGSLYPWANEVFYTCANVWLLLDCKPLAVLLQAMSFIVCSACTPFSPPTHRGLAYKTFATFVLLIMTDHRWPTSSVTWIFRVKMKHNACSYSLFSCFQHICCRIAIFGQNSRTWLNMLENLAELGVIVDFFARFLN